MVKLRQAERGALVALVAVGALLLVAAEAGGQTHRASGTWSSASDGELSGSWEASFQVDERDASGQASLISGTAKVAGLPGVTGGNIAGSIGSGSIQFGVMYETREVAVFSGTVKPEGFNGTFTTAAGRSGEWKGSLEPPPDATPAPASEGP
jgi:hypothetical protein